MFGEKVRKADVLRLGLDKHLKLSVNFVNHGYAKCGDKFLPFDEWEAKFRKMASWENAKTLASNDGMIAVCFTGIDMGFYIKDSELNKDNKQWRFGYNEDLKSALLSKLSNEEQSEILSNMIEQAIISHQKESEKFDGKVPPSTESFRGKVLTIRGVWDLPMLGAERIDVEHECQMLTKGPEITLVGIDGAFVEREDGMIFQVQEMFDKEWLEYQDSEESKQKMLESYRRGLDKRITNHEIDEEEAQNLLDQRKTNLDRPRSYDDDFYPAGSLPEDSVLVVRTQALLDLQDRLSQLDSNKNTHLDSRSETTYLNIIGALLEVTTGTFKDETFKNETELREFIAEKFDDLRGVSPRTLGEKFSLAKKALNNN